jgi:hypothetical protein
MRAGRVFAGGGRFFSAAGAVDAELAQRIDVTRAAARIDGGRQTATLSGLLGGYGADADLVDVRATFKDPENRALGSLWLGPVTRDDRARDTTLLPRSVKERIPPRTRAIDVKLLGHRNAGRYTDAYVDNVGLQLSLPGGAVSQPQLGDEPPVKHLKAFVGARLLTARPLVDGRGAGRVKLACPASTVGACSGVIRLRLPGAGGRRVAAFRIARNRVGTTAVRLQAAVGRRVRRERRVPATLSVVSRDGQALERQTVVPVTLVAVRRRARGRGSSGRAALRTRRRAAARSAA